MAKSKVGVACLAISTAVLFTVCAPVAIVAAQTEAVATNNDNSVSTAEVRNALTSVPGILNSSDQVATTSDGDSALNADVNGTALDVPKDASQGVSFGAGSGTTLDITLPNADKASAAKKVAPGTVAYDSGNGSANAVQATEDGGVRMLTIIDNPNAPTEYDYKVSVPNGGRIELMTDGSAVVIAADETAISSVSAPWAKDATGRSIETWFTTDGKTLTQHVRHNVPGVVYPVTADPWVKRWYGWDIQFNRRQTNNIMLGMVSAAVASTFIPEPSVSKIVAGMLGGLSGYAGWVYNKGGCLKLRVSYVGANIPGHYYKGNCR